MNKKGQITILVIIALIIVVSIILIATLIRNKVSVNLDASENPQAYISDCIQSYLVDAEQKILDGNGYLELNNNYALYNLNKPNEKVPYLCKSSQFYMPCVNQEPMLIEKVRKDLQILIEKDVDNCFNKLTTEIKKSASILEEGKLNYSIGLSEGYIIAKANKKIVIKKGEIQNTFEKFETKLQSPIYNLINTARQIVNYESELCEFNDIGWMMNFRDISITKFVTSDQTKIYNLQDRLTEKKLTFAIKSCVMPAGI
ncbi:MAG: hypothetical protein Q8L27_00190 [archaeon]|nr:hypothetical protein [archaeon]